MQICVVMCVGTECHYAMCIRIHTAELSQVVKYTVSATIRRIMRSVWMDWCIPVANTKDFLYFRHIDWPRAIRPSSYCVAIDWNALNVTMSYVIDSIRWISLVPPAIQIDGHTIPIVCAREWCPVTQSYCIQWSWLQLAVLASIAILLDLQQFAQTHHKETEINAQITSRELNMKLILRCTYLTPIDRIDTVTKFSPSLMKVALRILEKNKSKTYYFPFISRTEAMNSGNTHVRNSVEQIYLLAARDNENYKSIHLALVAHDPWLVHNTHNCRDQINRTKRIDRSSVS